VDRVAARRFARWPDGLLRSHDREEPEVVAGLVSEGYIEATDTNEGTMYRLAPMWAAKLEGISEDLAERASAN
jgi:hypothetical protein